MATQQLTYYLILLFLKHTKSYGVHFKLPEIEEKNFSMKSHLKYENIWDYCANRDNACVSNNTNVCAVKMKNNKKIYKDYKNACYLFLSNMCDHPEEEYYIATSGSCDEYLATRRSAENTGAPSSENDEESYNSTENYNTTVNGENQTETDPALRQAKPFSLLYRVEDSYDGHLCPHSCPNTYEPVCVNVNRGFGKYFKLMTFVNHCESDVYFCKNPLEFQPPPNEYENVKSSPLGWSFCGAARCVYAYLLSQGRLYPGMQGVRGTRAQRLGGAGRSPYTYIHTLTNRVYF